MEKYMFFNSSEGDIREYSAADMADFISGVCSNGILCGLQLTFEDHVLYVNPGKAVINGYIYVLDEKTAVNVRSTEGRRRDRIVLRLDMNNRSISIVNINGPSGEPQYVAVLTQSADIWEISLGVVTVEGDSRIITLIDTDQNEYTKDYRNLRGSPIRCGTEEPNASIGYDGDIYVQYEE